MINHILEKERHIDIIDDNVLYYDLFDNQYDNNNIIVAGQKKYEFLRNALNNHKNIYGDNFKAIIFNTKGDKSILLPAAVVKNAETINIDIFDPVCVNPFALLTDYDLFNYNTSLLFDMLIDFLYIFVPDRHIITTSMEDVVKRSIGIAIRQCYATYGKSLNVEHISVYLSHHSSDEIAGMVENIALFISKSGRFLLGKPDDRLKFNKLFTNVEFRRNIFDDCEHKIYLYKTSVSCILTSALFIHACNYVYKNEDDNSKTLLCIDSGKKITGVCLDVDRFLERAFRNFRPYDAGVVLME